MDKWKKLGINGTSFDVEIMDPASYVFESLLPLPFFSLRICVT